MRQLFKELDDINCTGLPAAPRGIMYSVKITDKRGRCQRRLANQPFIHEIDKVNVG